MSEAQLQHFAYQVITLSLVGGVAGSVLLHGMFLAIQAVFSRVIEFFERRNRIENARKRAAFFSRLAVKTQAEYDRLLIELANGGASVAGGAVGRACETLGAPSAGAQTVAQPLTAKEA